MSLDISYWSLILHSNFVIRHFSPRVWWLLPPSTRAHSLVSMPSLEHTLTLRVRYPECDPMGYLHHSIYLQYFEMGRVELLRSLGHSYADLEREGVFFVVVKAEVRYKAPARYDDELTLTTRLVKQTHVRYDHTYTLTRGDRLLAEGNTTIACVNRAGEVIQIPESISAGLGRKLT